MKIAVVNGNMRHASTWHCMDAIRDELAKFDDTEVKEYFLPKDLPHFCTGCFSCLSNGEDTCPHAAYTKPITEAMIESDLIILTSPVYGFDVSGQMKTFIDHLCFMWMSHRPNPQMFNKIGLTVSTTAGAGLGHTTKTMRNSLIYWGVKKVFSYKTTVAAMRWSDVSEENQKKKKRSKATCFTHLQISRKGRKTPESIIQKPFFQDDGEHAKKEHLEFNR